MTQLYSTLLLEAHNTGSVTGTCPAGYRWVVKDANMYSGGVIPCTLQLFKTTSGVVFYSVLFNGVAPARNQWSGMVTVDEGDSITFTVSAAQQADITVSGYQLSLP